MRSQIILFELSLNLFYRSDQTNTHIEMYSACLLILVVSGTAADGVLGPDVRNFITDPEIDILKRFFHMEKLNIDVSDTKFLNRYSQEVITKMSEQMLNYPDVPLKVLELNNQINTLILDTEIHNLIENDGDPIEPIDEAVMKAIDLIVPDPDYSPAKEDLRKFYVEQPALAKELLDRIRLAAEAKDLHTDNVARTLRNFYYHWIPLGRLMNVIKSKS